MTTIAAAINPEFSASVVVEGAPNLKDEISRMRTLHGKDVTDSCALVPGLVQYAGAEQLLSLIAPRPVLVVNPSKTVIDYVSQVFRVVGSEEKVYSIETNDALERRYAAYRWFGKWLRPRSDAYGFSEGDASATPARLQFADTLPTRETPKKPVNGSTLAEFLGRDLPEPKIPIVLQIALKQRIILQPHPGRRSSSLGCPPRADFEPFGNHLGATAVYRAV
jgi:hypothetical protein